MQNKYILCQNSLNPFNPSPTELILGIALTEPIVSDFIRSVKRSEDTCGHGIGLGCGAEGQDGNVIAEGEVKVDAVYEGGRELMSSRWRDTTMLGTVGTTIEI